jgi:hypothetical protein
MGQIAGEELEGFEQRRQDFNGRLADAVARLAMDPVQAWEDSDLKRGFVEYAKDPPYYTGKALAFLHLWAGCEFGGRAVLKGGGGFLDEVAPGGRAALEATPNVARATLPEEVALATPGLSQAGALRQAAVEAHTLAATATSRIGINQSTVALAEATLTDGTKQVFASGSGGYLLPRQINRLVELGVPRENIFSGAQYYRGFSAMENHAERVILRNLPEGAIVERWGITWGGQQRPIPCPACEPIVDEAGGILEGR